MSTTLVHDGNHASFVLCKNDDQNSVEKRPPQCYFTACENSSPWYTSYFDYSIHSHINITIFSAILQIVSTIRLNKYIKCSTFIL